MAAERELAVAVLGATGVTGSRAVPYLRERAAQLGVQWAIAGRDPGRLEALVAGWPSEARPAILHADVLDPSSVRTLTERAGVVVNFAGPFARLAPAVIAACVDTQTDYVDVSGEIGFVARMIDQHHERARERGVRIVQVAGFEALPFDLLTRLGMERCEAEHGRPAESADLVFTAAPPPGMPRLSDLISAGTFESLLEMLHGDESRALGDPAALVRGLADVESVRRASPIGLSPRRDPEAGMLAPMVPSPELNPPVIQRSLALLGVAPIRYREAVSVASLARPRAAQVGVAGTVSALHGGVRLLASAPAGVRDAAAKAFGGLAPRLASGPPADRLEGWSWSIHGAVRAGAEAESRVRVEARGHPGYLATSRMTAEAGLLLADPRADLPDAAGCLTPAAALGTAELGRFAAAGLDFEPS